MTRDWPRKTRNKNGSAAVQSVLWLEVPEHPVCVPTVDPATADGVVENCNHPQFLTSAVRAPPVRLGEWCQCELRPCLCGDLRGGPTHVRGAPPHPSTTGVVPRGRRSAVRTPRGGRQLRREFSPRGATSMIQRALCNAHKARNGSWLQPAGPGLDREVSGQRGPPRTAGGWPTDSRTEDGPRDSSAAGPSGWPRPRRSRRPLGVDPFFPVDPSLVVPMTTATRRVQEA